MKKNVAGSINKGRYAVNSPEAVLKEASAALKTLRQSACSLDEYLDRVSDPQLRRRLSNLLFGCFRHRRSLEEALNSCCTRPPAEDVKDLLLAALNMAVYQDSLAPGSVVNIAVTLARKEFNNFVARFVNAVLRKALECIDTTGSEVLPKTIAKRWKKAFPTEVYNQLTELFTSQARPTVRLRSGFAPAAGLELEPLELDLPWQFYICGDLGKLLASQEFAEGRFYIQDPAPAHVLQMLKNHADLLPEKLNFIDLCAAPGGKFIMSMELLSSLGKEVISATAFDRSRKRLELVKKNCMRCNINCHVQSGDAADPAIYPGKTFDLATCDVPCSNSGVFRRRPDALWRWNTQDMLDIAELQCNILHNAARLTAPGGLLLYSTCSLEAEENTLQIEKFLQAQRGFELVEEKLFMPQINNDGTYAALLIRKK